MNKENIKILHLITSLDGGGAQDNTLVTISGLKEKGYHVDLAAAPGGKREADALKIADNLFFIKALKDNSLSLLSNIIAIYQIFRLLKKNDYHIIHTHSSLAGICGRIAAKMACIPVIIHTVHGFPFHELTGTLKKNILIAFEKLAALMSDCIITVCRLHLEEMIQREIAPASKLINIYSGISLTKFNISKAKEEIKNDLKISDDALVVTMIARLAPQKAPGYFVEAAKLILKEKHGVIFLLVGDGPLREAISEQTASIPAIRLMGYREDVPEILKITDVFVLTSLYEGLGRALTEAMISKIPAVAPSIDGIPEILKNGDNGFLVPTKSPGAVAEKVLILLNNPQLRKKMGEKAYNTVVPAFTDDIMVDDIEKTYQKALKEKLNIDFT